MCFYVREVDGGPGYIMVHVTRIAAPEGCASCLAVTALLLSDGEQITPDMAYRWLIAGSALRVGSERGPLLQPAVRGGAYYVRVRAADSPDDELLRLPRSV